MLQADELTARPDTVLPTEISSAFVATYPLASCTCTVKELVPVAVGVPDISPVSGSSESPEGKLPETKDQVKGAVPVPA